MLGIVIGVVGLMISILLGIGVLFNIFFVLYSVLKVFGVVYLLWLVFKIVIGFVDELVGLVENKIKLIKC